MKLGTLKSAIRSTKGSPVLQIELAPGKVTNLALMKGPLLEALDEAFPGGKAVETGLTLEAQGDNVLLRPEAGGDCYAIKAAAPGPLLEIMEAPTPEAVMLDLPGVVSRDQALSGVKAITTLLDLDDAPAAPPPAPKPTLLLDL